MTCHQMPTIMPANPLHTDAMPDSDTRQRFIFEQLPIRGELVHLDHTWQTLLARRDYPPPLRQLLGEALAATALLAAVLKTEGLLTLQIQGTGPVSLLVVQGTGQGTLRATANWSGELANHSLAELCGDGRLVITLDPGQDHEQYQGIVELNGPSLAAALEHYFAHSEQLPTRLILSADGQTAAGLLLQRLPGELTDSDDWNRIKQLSATLTSNELLHLDNRTILYRLFHEDELRLLATEALSFHCTCSHERAASMLRTLEQSEIEEILAEEGEISVICEFCGMRYVFDAVDAGSLHTPPQSSPDTRH